MKRTIALTNETRFRGYTMRAYMQARLKELASTKSMEDISREIGYTKTKMISMFATGEAKVPLDKILPLAQALGAPLLPLFKLGMEQYGLDMAELAGAICDRVAIEGQSITDPLPDVAEEGETEASDGVAPEARQVAPDSEIEGMGPLYVALFFDIPSEFRRQFRIEAARRRLSGNEMLMLAFQTYFAYRNPPPR